MTGRHRRQSARLGAILRRTHRSGIDLACDLDEQTFAWLRSSSLRYSLLVFPARI